MAGTKVHRFGKSGENFQCPILKGGKFMSRHHHDDCCCYPMMYGCGMTGGYGGGYAAGYGFGGWGIRWIYALLVLIVIVLQFGRNFDKFGVVQRGPCDDDGSVTRKDGFFDRGLIDNSVLFIIVVFLLILCAGCSWGGSCGTGGGYGYY